MELKDRNLIALIKKKPELRGLSDAFVAEIVQRYRTRPAYKGTLSKRLEKQLIKQVRHELRKAAGRFNAPLEHTDLDPARIQKLIAKHASTRERLPYYPLIKELVCNGKPVSILDLGCGLNPLVLVESSTQYYAYDIRQDEIDLINAFFKKKGIAGHAQVADIRTASFPHADVCLLWKVIDLVDGSGHKKAEQLLKTIPCPRIIVSFSTKTLSGKPMNHPQRGWIERLCTRLGYRFHLEKIPNELFYIIEKPMPR